MKKLLILTGVLLFPLLAPSGANAQQVVAPCVTSFVTTNGTSQQNCARVTATNPLPITGTFSATLGGFTPATSGARGTPLTVTTSDSSGTLPVSAGGVVVVSNVGTTNPMYCNVNGIAATVADQPITANGGWASFTVPAAVTTLHCIATGGSTTANMLGGAGLFTGTGGGTGGSGGGGSVTQGTVPWVVSNAGTFAVQNSSAVVGQTASGSALSGNPVRIGLSDGTNAQNWLTALALGDGVNGNNTGAVAGWIWNGTTYDRITGTAALGQYVQAKSGGFAAGSVASGAMVDLGAIADAAATAGSTGTLSAKARLMTTQLAAINTTLGTPMQATGGTVGLVAGSAVIGHVICDSGCSGSGGTSSSFGSAFPATGTAIGLTDGTNMRGWLSAANALNSTGAGVGASQIVGQFDDVAPTAITENQFGNLRMSANRNLYGTIRDAAGNERGANVNASNQIAIAGPVTVVSGGIASGAVASGAMVDLGSQADSACGTATGTCSLIALQKFNNTSTASGTAAIGAAPPSSSVAIGNVGSGATGGLLVPQIACDNKAIYDASTSGSTELVALTASRTVYVCGYSIMASGTVNVKLIYGTGTACATGSNNMLPAFQLTTQVGLVDGSPFYRGLKTASANALCINTSAGVAVQAIVYYAVL